MGVNRIFLFFALVLCLVGCGSGGGSGGGSSTPSSAVTFSPQSMTMTVLSGISFPFSFQVSVTDSAAFSGVSTLYVYVVDPNNILTGTVTLTQVDSLHYSARVDTSPLLALGRYQGNFEIKLCKNVSCSEQIQGSPLPLPYDLTVASCLPNIGVGTPDMSAAVSSWNNPPEEPHRTVTVQGCQPWTATTTTPWLRIDGGAGNGATTGMFTVAYLSSGLGVGSYNGSVTVQWADGHIINVPVALTVLP